MWGAVKAAFHDFVPIVMLASSLETSALNPKPWGFLEASKGGMKVGRIEDPLDKASYFGITPHSHSDKPGKVCSCRLGSTIAFRV